MILLLPPVFSDVHRQVKLALERNGFTQSEELEPKAGCRRFRLS